MRTSKRILIRKHESKFVAFLSTSAGNAKNVMIKWNFIPDISEKISCVCTFVHTSLPKA
jgi:hypothetical protein